MAQVKKPKLRQAILTASFSLFSGNGYHNTTIAQIAKQAKVEGQVILEATIARDGSVKDVRVLRGNALFNDAAMEAVKKWKYTPTMLNDQPVEVLMTVVVNFVLK